MNFHSYGESPSKLVRIITGQSVLIDPSSRIAIKFASDIYRGIGIKIKDNGYNYLDGREYLSKYEKLKIIFFSIIDVPKILFIKKNHNHVMHSLLKDEYLSELK